MGCRARVSSRASRAPPTTTPTPQARCPHGRPPNVLVEKTNPPRRRPILAEYGASGEFTARDRSVPPQAHGVAACVARMTRYIALSRAQADQQRQIEPEVLRDGSRDAHRFCPVDAVGGARRDERRRRTEGRRKHVCGAPSAHSHPPLLVSASPPSRRHYGVSVRLASGELLDTAPAPLPPPRSPADILVGTAGASLCC